MKEMYSASSRDDRQKREQLRQEREMAKFVQMYPLNNLCGMLDSSYKCIVHIILFLFKL
jgi:hypothetical protein